MNLQFFSISSEQYQLVYSPVILVILMTVADEDVILVAADEGRHRFRLPEVQIFRATSALNFDVSSRVRAGRTPGSPGTDPG